MSRRGDVRDLQERQRIAPRDPVHSPSRSARSRRPAGRPRRRGRRRLRVCARRHSSRAEPRRPVEAEAIARTVRQQYCERRLNDELRAYLMEPIVRAPFTTNTDGGRWWTSSALPSTSSEPSLWSIPAASTSSGREITTDVDVRTSRTATPAQRIKRAVSAPTRSARRHPDRPVDADRLAVDHPVGDDVGDERRELGRIAEPLRVRDLLGERLLRLLRQ